MEYIIGGVRGFNLTTYLKAMKVRYELFELYLRDNKVHWEDDPNAEIIQEEWDKIEPLTVQEAFLEENQEKRRVLFSCLGPARIFEKVKPTLVDRKVLKLKNKTWNEKGELEEKEIEDVYELYKISWEKLMGGTEISWATHHNELRVVRCWCTTTGREYWIFVDQVFKNGSEHRFISIRKHIEDAIEAIAWTFKVGILPEDIEEIYRQGDCLVVKAAKDAKALPEDKWYHLDPETYKSKLVAQS